MSARMSTRVAVERLLGGEVVGRAQDVLVVLLGEDVVLVVEEAGQAHVEDLDDAGAVDEDVARLDVAVDQARSRGRAASPRAACRDVVAGADRRPAGRSS